MKTELNVAGCSNNIIRCSLSQLEARDNVNKQQGTDELITRSMLAKVAS